MRDASVGLVRRLARQADQGSSSGRGAGPSCAAPARGATLAVEREQDRADDDQR